MIKICVWCSKEFETEFHRTRYCSDDCRIAAYQSKRAKDTTTIKLKCPTCGRTFAAPHTRRKYCSPECKLTHDKAIAKERYRESKGQKKVTSADLRERTYAINRERKIAQREAQEWLRKYRHATNDECMDMLAEACNIDKTEWRRLPTTIRLKKKVAVLDVKRSLAARRGKAYDN